MTGFAINVFQGSVPRRADYLQTSGSSIAMDCKLEHGTLESWREPKLERTLPAYALTHFCLEGVEHVFNCHVSVARGSPHCREFFATGIDDPLLGTDHLMRWVESQGQQWETAGMPTYLTPIVASCPTAKDQEDSHTVTYAYQYFRTRDSAYSPISEASLPIATNPMEPVDLFIPGQPDPMWGIDEVVVYRGVFGMTGYDEIVNISDHSWVEIARLPVSTMNLTDGMNPTEAFPPCTHDLVIPPVLGLRDVVAVTGTSTLAGFKGRSVYFSQNNEYYNWPHEYELEDDICAIAESNGIVYVMTDSYSYSIAGAPCETAGTRPVVRAPVAYPLVVTGAKNWCATPEGVVYISPVGAVALVGNSPPVVITTPFYAEDDWQQLVPESLVPAYYRGRLFVFGHVKSFVIVLSTTPEQGLGLDTHSSLSVTGVKSVGYSRSNVMQLVVNNGLYSWDRGEALLPHLWKSGEFVLGVPMTFGACKVVAEGGTERITIEGDGRVIIDRDAPYKKDFSLPLWGTSARYYVTLRGTGSVKLVSIATSMKELKA